jgi:excisionase family DNA binding protein
MEKYLTISEVCDILQVKKHYIYGLTSQKRIPFFKMGRFLRFKKEDIDEWLRKSRTAGSETPQQLKEVLAKHGQDF